MHWHWCWPVAAGPRSRILQKSRRIAKDFRRVGPLLDRAVHQAVVFLEAGRIVEPKSSVTSLFHWTDA